MGNSGSRTLPDSFHCCISMELMKDPVMDCFNHTYERQNIEKALRYRPGYCPMTNQQYPDGDAKLRTNLALRQAIESMVPPAHGRGRSAPAGKSHYPARVCGGEFPTRWIDRGRSNTLCFHHLADSACGSGQAASLAVVRLTWCSGVPSQVVMTWRH